MNELNANQYSINPDEYIPISFFFSQFANAVYKIELYVAYWSVICVPLSFLMCNTVKRKFVYELIPQKLRGSIRLPNFCRRANAQNAVIPIESTNNHVIPRFRG